ncbi:protein-L-isoaspartate(D-aspartate) O-methyltransferase [candidate division KSB1 bacterium]
MPADAQQVDRYENLRIRMVETQIIDRDVRNPAVLDAMQAVKRHLFLPENMRNAAYFDTALPIGYGQTISQPYIVAYMTETLQLEPHYKVLEIGSGSGYQAAVLAEIIDSVYTVEIIPELGESVIRRFDSLGYDNIRVKIADGYDGWEAHAPFDAIIVTAAAEYIPPPLIRQLKNGGRMIIPVGSPFFAQNLMLVEKQDDKITTHNLMLVRFVPLTRKR